MMNDSIKQICALSDAFGPSGFEEDIAALVKKMLVQVKDVHEDSLHNVTAQSIKNTGNRLKVMLDAHLDEVGFIIQAVKPNGTMPFLPLGGWVANTAPAHKVKVRSTDGELIEGIIAAKPIHFMSESEKHAGADLSKMVIDVGAVSDIDLKENFKIGMAAPVVPDVTCSYDEKHDLILGKALDCRIGVSALIDTLKELQQPAADVCASFSVQEEVGERGIQANLERLKPDLAIVFEGCPADDTFQEPYMIQTALKKGCMLRHFDRSMITHPGFQRFALQLADAKQIPCQESVRSGGGTNGAFIHVKDIPTIVIGIPVRYIHSHHGFASYADYRSAVDLAKAILENIQSAPFCA